MNNAMGSNAARVAEIFNQAGNAFNKLGELAMSLASANNSRSGAAANKWSDEEVTMLRDAVRRFGRDISQLTRVLRNKSVAQIRNQLRRKAFKDAGLNDPGNMVEVKPDLGSMGGHDGGSHSGNVPDEDSLGPDSRRMAPKRPRVPLSARVESPLQHPAEKRRRIGSLDERPVSQAGQVLVSSGGAQSLAGQAVNVRVAPRQAPTMAQAMRMRLKEEELEEEEEDDDDEEEEGIDVEEDTEPGYEAESLTPSTQDRHISRRGPSDIEDDEEELEMDEEEEEELEEDMKDEEIEDEDAEDLLVDDDEEDDIDDDDNLNI